MSNPADIATNRHPRDTSGRLTALEIKARYQGATLIDHGERITANEQALSAGRVTHAKMAGDIAAVRTLSEQTNRHIVWGVRLVLGAIIGAVIGLVVYAPKPYPAAPYHAPAAKESQR